jgi:predicted RND superfamily exporter protein
MLFLKINELNEYAYEHFFEIDDLKKSYYKYTQLHQTVEKCEHIEKVDKRKINRLIKEFKGLCKKIIKRDENFDIEEYTLYMQALVTINVKIQKILSDWRYRKNKEISDIEKEYKKVNNYLSYANSSFDVILNNHTTLFILLSFAAFVFGGLIFYIAIRSILGTLLNLLLLVIAFLIYFFYNKSIMRSFNIDYINRTISKNTYIKSSKIKKANRNLKYILNFKK